MRLFKAYPVVKNLNVLNLPIKNLPIKSQAALLVSLFVLAVALLSSLASSQAMASEYSESVTVELRLRNRHPVSGTWLGFWDYIEVVQTTTCNEALNKCFQETGNPCSIVQQRNNRGASGYDYGPTQFTCVVASQETSRPASSTSTPNPLPTK